MSAETYYSVECDVQRADDHAACEKCYGTKRIPIAAPLVAPRVSEQFTQFLACSLIALALALAFLAVWGKR